MHGATDEFLLGLGVDRARLQPREAWFDHLWRDQQIPEDDPRRERFYVAWVLDGVVVGHSSINQIQWGQQAFGHLHLWRSDLRRAGLGADFMRRSVSFYFERFNLNVLYVEPYAYNPGPNRVLKKLGFKLVKQHRTVPGPMNFKQDVNRWEMKRTDWR